MEKDLSEKQEKYFRFYFQFQTQLDTGVGI